MARQRFDFNRAWARLSFTQRQRLRLYAKLAKLLESGMPLLRCLEDLYFRESRNGERASDPIAVVLRDWIGTVRSGGRMGEAVEGWVPNFERMIIAAGDESGNLPSGLRSVITFVTAGARIRKAVLGGALYPTLILAMVIGYLVLFGAVIVPKFAVVSDPVRWQGAARSLYLLSLAVQSWLPLMIGVPLAAMAATAWSLPRWRGKARVQADKLPPWSIYRLVVGSGFLTSLSALVDAGVPVERALSSINAKASPWLRERLSKAVFGLKSGLNLGEALRHAGHEFPSREIIDDLCVYALYGGFAAALQRVASEWLDEGVSIVETRMRVATGAAVLVLAVVIMWIVAGFFGIQQEIVNSTRRTG